MDKKQKTIITLAQAYELKNTTLTDRIESILVPEINLPTQLKEKLETLGNTPLDEPEIYETIIKADEDKLRSILFKDMKEDDFDLFDITDFTIAVTKKVTDSIDEDGMFKTTPALDKMKLPRSSDMKDIRQMLNNNASELKLSNKFYKIAGLDKKDLTDWEQSLFTRISIDFMNATASAVQMRQAVDRTPFARYLKN